MKIIFLVYLLLAASLKALASSSEAVKDVKDVDLILYVVIFFMFLPELLFTVSRKFRRWLKSGVEDGDDVLQKIDIKDSIMQLSAIWCMRVFVLGSFLSIFRGLEVKDIILTYSFFGSIGLEGIMFLKTFVKFKNE